MAFDPTELDNIFYGDETLAIFIDGANLYSAGKALGYDLDYGRLRSLFERQGRLIRAYYYTAIIERDDFSAIRPLTDWLDYNGYHVITKAAKEVVDRDGRKRIKGNMDIQISLDMYRMTDKIEHMILISGDGDFRPAVEAVQSRGVRVTVLSTAKTSPPMLADELRRQADNILDLADMEELIGRE